jgi:hypothetical protein
LEVDKTTNHSVDLIRDINITLDTQE